VINLPTTNALMVCDLVRFVHRERTGTRTARLRDRVSGRPVAFRAHPAGILPVRAGSGPRPEMHVIIRFITCTKSPHALRQTRPPIRHPDGPNPAGPPRAGPPALDHRHPRRHPGGSRAFRRDVAHFLRTLAIATPAGLRQVDHKAVIAWEGFMCESEGAAPSTVRRRLAALSSLFKHLVRHGEAARNPVAEIARPAINRDEGSTLAFAKAQAREMLDAPVEDTVAGLRDRALLSVACRSGCGAPKSRPSRSATCTRTAAMTRCGWSARAAGARRSPINPQTAARLRAYLELAGHGADLDGPMFRLLRTSGKRQEERRPMDPDAIDRVVRSFATALGSIAASRRARCAPPSSPRHWKTAPSSKMCKRRRPS